MRGIMQGVLEISKNLALSSSYIIKGNKGE